MILGHLLVVDDDKRLLQLLKKYLSKFGFLVSVAEDSCEAEEILKLLTIDAIVMDVMMPNKNGIEYTKFLRNKGLKIPILILTAVGDSESRIIGLEAGADDYLSKPFDPKELFLRIKNLLKHREGSQNTIIFGPYIYTKSTEILTKDNQVINLTKAEQQLLKVLISHANIVLTREELAKKMQIDSIRTIDVQITRLRKKIEPDLKHPIWIQSVRSQGYKLVRL